MRQVDLNELEYLASVARENLWSMTKAPDGAPRIYLHWSAGHYFQKFDDYHVNITADGKLWVTTNDLSEVLPHTYYRNSGAVGISLCCACGATTQDLGNEPPTAAQIEAMAQAIRAVADGLWLTINKHYVLTHGEAADNEDGWNVQYPDGGMYGPKHTVERWDLEYLGTDESPAYNPWATDGSRGGDVLRGKALWYKQQKDGN